MPIQILRTLGDILYSRHGLRAECPACGWGKNLDLELLVRTQQKGHWTLQQLRNLLVCKICRTRKPDSRPDLLVTFVSPPH